MTTVNPDASRTTSWRESRFRCCVRHAAGIFGIPTIFVNGRYVPAEAHGEDVLGAILTEASDG